MNKSMFLSIEITTLCNLQCKYCFALANLNQPAHMNWNTNQSLIKEGFALGYRRLHLSGGEPFLYPKIQHTLDLAIQTGFEKVLINTNATLLTSETCKKLAELKPFISLTCSLNGERENHDLFCGKGNYERTIQGLSNALNQGLPIDIYTIASKPMVDRIPIFTESLFTQFPDLKALFFIQLRRAENKKPELKNLMLTPKDFITLIRQMGFLSLYGYPVHFLENSLYNIVKNRLKLDRLPKSQPIFTKHKIFILQDEKITANHSSRNFYQRYQPGNLNKVLENCSYLRDTTNNVTICPNCEFHELCKTHGNFRPTASQQNDLNDNSHFCQRVLRELN